MESFELYLKKCLQDIEYRFQDAKQEEELEMTNRLAEALDVSRHSLLSQFSPDETYKGSEIHKAIERSLDAFLKGLSISTACKGKKRMGEAVKREQYKKAFVDAMLRTGFIGNQQYADELQDVVEEISRASASQTGSAPPRRSEVLHAANETSDKIQEVIQVLKTALKTDKGNESQSGGLNKAAQDAVEKLEVSIVPLQAKIAGGRGNRVYSDFLDSLRGDIEDSAKEPLIVPNVQHVTGDKGNKYHSAFLDSLGKAASSGAVPEKEQEKQPGSSSVPENQKQKQPEKAQQNSESKKK